MTTRGDQTRERIIEAAERLFAERGLTGVSLREINVAAGQRNTAALHYHFNSREGLLKAIIDKHLPRLGARQQQLLDEVLADGRESDLRALVDACIRPLCEYLDVGPSERAWICLSATLAPQPEKTWHDVEVQGQPAGRELRRRMVKILRKDLPTELAAERVMIAFTATLHVLGDRARLVDAPRPARAVIPAGAFTANVLDMVFGALTAPVSPPALEVTSHT